MNKIISFLLIGMLPAVVLAADNLRVEHRDYLLNVGPRTPEQIGAFYEARGFPRPAVDLLKQQCYLTVYFHNRSQHIIVVDVAEWKFITIDGEVKRLDRTYWKQRWQQEGLEQRLQSTFRWTLLPEHLDYRADEREGGNLILPYGEKPMTLYATIHHKEDGAERKETIKLEGIQCLR